MNLPQLIEWAWSNPKPVEKEYCDEINGTWVYMNVSTEGGIHVEHTIHKDDTFTVEVEEEITEDTVISKLVHYSAYGFKGTKNDTSINNVKDDVSLAFYVMNSDRTMTLIWREGKLVE